MGLKIAAWVVIAVGTAALAYALRTGLAESGTAAALGVFLIFLGINAFNTARISKLEETIKQLKNRME